MASNLRKGEARQQLLQRGISPRLLEAELAAAYVGLGADAFMAAVEQGLYPRPIEIGRRKHWDRRALDAVIDAFSALEITKIQETPDDLDRAIDAT